MKRILIPWVGPWLDKGEAAMIIAMANDIREQIADSNITILMGLAFDDRDKINYARYDLKALPSILGSIYWIISCLNSLTFRSIKIIIVFIALVILMSKNIIWIYMFKYLKVDFNLLVRDNAETVKEYLKADWIIFCGGEYIADIDLGLVTVLYEIVFCKLLGKPVMLYAQSFGKFDNYFIRIIIRYVLNKTDLITTREVISKKYLEELGVNAPLFLTADASFTLPSISYGDAALLLERESGIPQSELLVGITAIYWNEPWQEKQISKRLDNYFRAIAESIDYITTNLDAYVIFFPQNKAIDPYRNDEFAAMKIIEYVRNKSKVISIKEDYAPEQLKGMYGCMSLFIGTRLHSCILALSMSVPTVAIGYRHKAWGIMRMLDLEDYVCDIGTISSNELISKTERAWKNRYGIKEQLDKKIKLAQNDSRANILLAKKYLDYSQAPKE